MERLDFARQLARNALLWIVPVALLWLALTPFYNLFLATAAERALHLGESPDSTRLYVRDTHVLHIVRNDIAGGQTTLHEARLTDFHFDWILLGVLFLATPGVPASQRLRSLGMSAVGLAVFHVLLTVFYVESFYANGLGDWSLRHYGALARNFWGLGKHLLDLPFKFALPFAMWAASFWQSLERQPARTPKPAGRR